MSQILNFEFCWTVAFSALLYRFIQSLLPDCSDRYYVFKPLEPKWIALQLLITSFCFYCTTLIWRDCNIILIEISRETNNRDCGKLEIFPIWPNLSAYTCRCNKSSGLRWCSLNITASAAFNSIGIKRRADKNWCWLLWIWINRCFQYSIFFNFYAFFNNLSAVMIKYWEWSRKKYR